MLRPTGPWLQRREHAQATAADAKFHRTRPNELAVHFHRHLFLAAHSQVFRLKIFHVRRRDLRGENHVLQVADDFYVAQAFENNHVEQAVVDDGLFEERKPSAIKTAVADEYERAFLHHGVLRFDPETRRLAGSDLRCGNQIAEWPEIPFEGAAGFFDNLGIETDAGELNEMFSVGARQIDGTNPILPDNFPAGAQIIRGQTQLGGEDVHRSDREQAERNIFARDAVHDFIDGAIATGGDDSFKTFRGGMARQDFRFPRVRGGAEDRSARDRFHLGAQPVRAGAASGGVENDDGLFHGNEAVRALVFS